MNEDNKTTPAPEAQEETSSLESQMRTGYAALSAAVDGEARLKIGCDISGINKSPRWTAGIGWEVYGFGDTAFEAVADAVSKHGTSESRRAEKLEKLRKDAAELDCEILEGGQ